LLSVFLNEHCFIATMRLQTILAISSALAVSAQKSKCMTTKEILAKPAPDPLVPFKPGSADFPCDMGSAIPLGKVPSGCAQLEIIVGMP
jgi:hypothetical protein